jgi:hypothetical protein
MLQGESHSRRNAPLTYTLESPTTQADETPCNESCRHFARCQAEGLGCAALELFENTGRLSAYAPRQPTAAIYQTIHAPRPAAAVNG